MGIIGYKADDITSTRYSCDIIIGMNTELEDVRGIGRRVLATRRKSLQNLSHGSVVTFPWDESGRLLHMLICHEVGVGGWKYADRHIRYGLDYLRYREPQSERGYGIVQIGAGRVGQRDKADLPSINSAIANSLLPVTMFIFDRPQLADQPSVALMPPLKASSVWTRERGELRFAA